MADIYNTSQDNISGYGNISNDGDRNSTSDDYVHARFNVKVVTCLIVCISLPLTIMAIRALHSMVPAPIYIINLFITDLIQLICLIVEVVPHEDKMISIVFNNIHAYCLSVSVCFMGCVAIQRYLIMAWPLWYRFRRNTKSSAVVCVLVWVFPIVSHIQFLWDREIERIFWAIHFLLPFPLLIFSLVGTLKALSASISVPSDEKRRIVGTLVLVLLIYSLLFLPNIIWYLAGGFENITLYTMCAVLFRLNPLADLVLYVFMKKGTIDKLLVAVCCCRMDRNDIEMNLSAGGGDTSSAGFTLNSSPLSGQSEQQM